VDHLQTAERVIGPGVEICRARTVEQLMAVDFQIGVQNRLPSDEDVHVFLIGRAAESFSDTMIR
jgi:hypothetical protein